MLDLQKLSQEREKASEDKADLFDFYHKNWSSLTQELTRLDDKLALIANNLSHITYDELSQAERNIYASLSKDGYLELDANKVVILGKVFENR